MTAATPMESVSPALEITDLEAGYGPTLIARGISITVNVGEMVTIIGPNGSGQIDDDQSDIWIG